MSQAIGLHIDAAIAALNNSPIGALQLRLRKQIWRGLFPDQTSQGIEIGRSRCTELDILCVEHVLDIWYAVFPDDDAPGRLIDIARLTLRGEMDKKISMRARDDAYVDIVENRSYEESQYPAMFVGHAAANVIVSALASEIPVIDDLRDEDLDAESYDPSYLAASAVAGGLNHMANGSPERRAIFWRWYLTVAIPKVMNANFSK